MANFKTKIQISVIAGLAFLAIGLFAPSRVHAQYVQNNLIDDNLFLDAASMSQSSIQSFLVARGGALANNRSWSGRDNATVPASQIIYEAAYDYGISPKAILATLQKEQSLVTDPNPSSSQFNFAMGYGCPDSTGCQASYQGFFNQVDNGTWQLRYNFERARGNNTWWRNSSIYPCGSASHFYSNGLYVGNYVTFYDGGGAPYASFQLNDAATASLYCYTPHAYPGDANYYYSGSYNFVSAYESWFGSTQPGVSVSSSLRVYSTNTPGLFTNNPVTASFTLTNNTNWPIGVGSMAVAVRNSSGANYDMALVPMLIPAYATVTYSSSENLPEGTYTFWITNNTNGTWSDNTPESSSIDNPRQVTAVVKPMPVITTQPSSSVAAMRVGKNTNMSFIVQNSSSTNSVDLGKLSLAIRSPSGVNVDLPPQPVVIAAGGSYTFSSPFIPNEIGTYNTFITETPDNGQSWYQNGFPATASGVNSAVAFNVKPNPTLTQTPTLSISTPRVGQQVTASFQVQNWGDSAVNVGTLGLAIRGPNGQNLDPSAAPTTIPAASTFTYNANATFQTPGTYTAWVIVTQDGGRTWDNTTYPTPEGNVARRITFTVLPNPTITVQPTITTSDPRTGKALSATFTIHNWGDSAVNVGGVALATRDSRGRNVDFGLQNVVIPAKQDYVYVSTNPNPTTTGTYTSWITVTQDGGRTWDDTTYPMLESSSINRRITFNVKDGVTLTQTPTLSISTPRVGQQVTASFQVQNWGDSAVNVGTLGLAIRGPNGQNLDPSAAPTTIPAASTFTYNANATFQTPGTYTAWVIVTQDGGRTWDNTTYPPIENSSVSRLITFTVQP